MSKKTCGNNQLGLDTNSFWQIPYTRNAFHLVDHLLGIPLRTPVLEMELLVVVVLLRGGR